MLDVTNITYRYPAVPVLRECSFSIGSGEICLLLGANGSGKSTLLSLIAGMKRPTSGRVVIQSQQQIKVRFGGHELMLYGGLSVRENLELFGILCGIPASSVQKALERWGLVQYQNRSINSLSKGYRARASLARALLGSSSILLLDEPTASLDDGGAAILGDILQEEGRKGSGCVIATHDLARLLPIATRIILLKDGAVGSDSGPGARADRSMSDVVERYRSLNR